MEQIGFAFAVPRKIDFHRFKLSTQAGPRDRRKNFRE